MKMLFSRKKFVMLLGACAISGSSLASDYKANALPQNEQLLVDQFKSCAENAVGQGMDTIDDVSDACAAEKAQIDTALPGLAEHITQNLLS